jgi:solute carrier family 25 carnitine/acylcarnitine transporter 20/29
MVTKAFCLFVLSLSYVCSFTVSHSKRNKVTASLAMMIDQHQDTVLTLLSLASGSTAGSLATAAANPLEALKTKMQTVAMSGVTSVGLIDVARRTLRDEGIHGFFNGIRGTMLGQALITGIAFATNTWALSVLMTALGHSSPDLVDLTMASSLSGFLTSFAVNPVERIRILMQTDSTGKYTSTLHCIREVLAEDGPDGLFFRGLSATILREIPGYCIYFVAYAVLMKSELAVSAGDAAPCICGALAGCLSWLPVFPLDVIKT